MKREKRKRKAYMRIMQWGNRRKKRLSAVMMLLLCLCINVACGGMNSVRSDEEAETLKRKGTPAQETEETVKMEEAMEEEETAKAEETVETEEIKSQTFGETAEQAVMFTEEDLPEEIRILLDYKSWTDDTQAVIRTEEELKNSGMPEEFQQIVTGDFSRVRGLSDESKEGLKEDYESRENWAYMTQDMDGDGIEELCIKDRRGRTAVFYEFWDGSYRPGMFGRWSLGEKESSLLTEKDWGENDFFLNNGLFVLMFKSCDGNNSYFSIDVACLNQQGTFSFIEELDIDIVNDISPEYGIHFEKTGIYYEIKGHDEEKDKYVSEEVSEQDAAEWCEDNIYPYMMSEEEWYAVPQ